MYRIRQTIVDFANSESVPLSQFILDEIKIENFLVYISWNIEIGENLDVFIHTACYVFIKWELTML